VALVMVIFLTEAVVAILLLALAPQFPITGLHLGDRHGARIAGFALAAYGATKMLAQPASGWLVDRLSPLVVLLAGLALTLPVIVLMAQVRSALAFVVACALLGVTLAVVWPAVFAAVGARYAAQVQGRLLALVSMGQIAGTAVGFGVGALLIDHASYSAAFLVSLVLGAAALALSPAAAAEMRAGAVSTATHQSERLQAGAFRALAEPSVALLVTTIMLASVAVAMLQPDLKPYSERILHLSFSTFALLLVPPGVVAAVLLVPAGYLADRIGRPLPMVAGLLLFALCLVLITTTRSPLTASVIATFAAAGYVLSLPALSASILDVANQRNRGLLTGLTSSIQAIGLVIGPLIGGMLVDAYGALAPFRVSAVVVLAGAALALLYGARVRARGVSRAAPVA
jgi:MFS family permease